MYLLGLDIGSSSIKASLVSARDGALVGTSSSPETEMAIMAPRPGWAEQSPEAWWANCCQAVKKLLRKTRVKKTDIAAIGISYQMHGLVAVDAAGQVLRPAIIWCDSRAVEIGNSAFRQLGPEHCLPHYLNSPGNFTASKLKWVLDEEPAIFEKIARVFLPGDYIAYRMTGEAATTLSGLSEGVFWDFQENAPARRLMQHYGFSEKLLPPIVPTFGQHGKLAPQAAAELGLAPGIPLTYRAGDQPNNALSLNVLQPGEVAATGGTSGVVYGVVDKPAFDPKSRVNSFAHVNHTSEKPRIGVLLCINGAGIQYAWMRRQVGGGKFSYPDMERLAATAPTGSDGLRILPFGNGAERIFENRDIGAQLLNLQFNRHGQAHLFRAALEGVAFSFVFGVQILREMGLDIAVMRVGNDNLFQSAIFASSISTLLGCRIEMLRSTGAAGAAIAAGVGIGLWADASEGLGALQTVHVYEPLSGEKPALEAAFDDWGKFLNAP